MASLLVFFCGLAVIIMGDGPTRLRFFAGARVAAEKPSSVTMMRKGEDTQITATPSGTAEKL